MLGIYVLWTMMVTIFAEVINNISLGFTKFVNRSRGIPDPVKTIIDDTEPAEVVAAVPAPAETHLLYNFQAKARYDELAEYYRTLQSQDPKDYATLPEFCEIGGEYPLLQDAVYQDNCPAVCHVALAEYRAATDRMTPFWGSGLTTAQQGIVNDMCAAGQPMIDAGCVSPVDITQETYWQTLCADPASTTVDLAWNTAMKYLYDNLINAHVDSKVVNSWIAANVCPLVAQINTNCSAAHIAERYAQDPYYQLCSRGSDCPTVADKWYADAEPVRTMDDAGINMLDTINQFCADDSDMKRCGYDFYSTDALYTQWCKSPDCTRNYLTYIDARDDFNWSVQNGVSEDGRFQQMMNTVCPAADAMINTCADPKMGSWVKDDGYYKQYCANPVCTEKQRTMQQERAAFSWSVESGVDQDGQYQQAMKDLCPAIQAVVDEPTCADKSVTADGYYKQYCAAPACTAVQYDMYQAQQRFSWGLQQGVNQDGQYQMAIGDLCPAMQAVVDETTCVDKSVTGDGYYRQYCANPACTQAQYTQFKANAKLANYAAGNVDQGGIWQLMISDVCPAFEGVFKTCGDDSGRADGYYKQYCDTSSCMNKRYDLYRKQQDFNNVVTQGITASARNQLLVSSLCPAMQTIMDDPTCVNKSDVTDNYYWKNYCSDMKCLMPKTILDGKQQDFNWAMSQNGGDQDSMYQSLERDICPAMYNLAATCSRPDYIDAMHQDNYWKNYCVDGLDCVKARHQLQMAEKNFSYNLAFNPTQDTEYQLAKLYLCPAFTAVLNNCKSNQAAIDYVLNHPMYDKWCKYAACSDAMSVVNNAKADYNWNIRFSNTYNSTIQMAKNSVCPSMETALAACRPGSTQQAQIRSEPLYNQWCDMGVPCLNAQYGLYAASSQWLNNWNSYNDSNHQYLVDNYACPQIRNVAAVCSPYAWGKYNNNPGVGQWDYMMGRCPVASPTTKVPILIKDNTTGRYLTRAADADQSPVTLAALDTVGLGARQQWYRDSVYTTTVRAVSTANSFGQDRALAYNSSTNRVVVADTGVRSNQSWHMWTTPDAAAWTLLYNSQCIAEDASGVLSTAACGASNTVRLGIVPLN